MWVRVSIAIVFTLVATACFAAPTKKISLSLDEAILLSVRDNPNVQSAKLSYVMQKCNTWVQEWAFYPHYQFQASGSLTRDRIANNPFANSQNVNVQPSVSLQTPIGTQLSLTSNNPGTNGHFNPNLSLQIMQPLLRGFGTPVVEAALNNARDSETISKLSVENTLRTTVTAVINAYLDVLSAEKTIQIDEDALKRAEKSVQQTKLYIKAGHKAGNEQITVEANAASAKLQLESDKNNLMQARYALLAAIGVDPNSDMSFVNINIDALIKKYHQLTLNQAKKLILQNDIQYQIDRITLHGPTNRSLLVAEDNTRWQLNFTASGTTTNNRGGQNVGVSNSINGINQTQSIALTLQVPIDDQVSKQAVMSAKIALKQAELGLLQEKWNKETSAINGWNNVKSAERALKFANAAEQLQEKTYNLNYQKYLHGLIDSLELQTALVSLIQSKQALLNARISYLKALVNMDLLIGNTLRTWDVGVRL